MNLTLQPTFCLHLDFFKIVVALAGGLYRHCIAIVLLQARLKPLAETLG